MALPTGPVGDKTLLMLNFLRSLALSLLFLPYSQSFVTHSIQPQSLSTKASTSLPMASTAPISNLSSATSLGSDGLRKLVQEASIASSENQLDLPGIAWMEHLNLVVGSMDVAKKFYSEFLGLTPDKDNIKHFNLGQQQFHLAATDEPAQIVCGSIGLTVPSLQRIRERIEAAKSNLAGTSFSVLADNKENMMTVVCPWGNTFHLYDISIDDKSNNSPKSSQKMVNSHLIGGAYGPHRMAVRGNPGIRFVEVACRVGAVDSIASFYEKTLECSVTRTKVSREDGTEADAAVVCFGPTVHFAFIESTNLSDEMVEKMKGVHTCIYIPSFQKTYEKLKGRDLIWTNPRFTHLDSCDTWEEAFASRTFRFKDILDVNTGEKIMEFEHETRPMMHGQYMKVPSYTPN